MTLAAMQSVRRAIAVAGVALVVGIAAAPMAAADPARPTNARSEVTRLEPPSNVVRLDVVGGDAFLRIRVDRGHEVVVRGYEDEPYLRVLGDGTVERNERSPAVYLNENRYGASDRPANADAAAEPDWRAVGNSGTYTWHDHRIHFMGLGDPVGMNWTVPIVVDGVGALVMGRLDVVGAPASWPWWIVAVAICAGVLYFLRRFLSRAVAVCVAAVPAMIVAIGELASVPKSAGGSIAPLLAPVCAVVFIGLAFVMARSRQSMLAGGGGALAVWTFTRLNTWNHAVLLSGLPAWFERAAAAVALGVGAGVFLAIASVFAGVQLPWIAQPGSPNQPGARSSKYRLTSAQRSSASHNSSSPR
jgi:hypothetical protein